MNHAIQIDDKVMQQTMQPLVGDDPDATIERLKTEVAGGAVAGNPSEFGEIVFVFLRQAFKMDALMQILHITEFVGTKDQGFNQLLFEAIRSGKWSSMLVHRKNRVLAQCFKSNSLKFPSVWAQGFDILLLVHFPVALSIVGSEACGDLARKFEHYRLGGNPSASKTTRPEPLWLTVSFVRHAQAERLGALWSSTRIDKLYLSPTARTRQTTEKLLDGRADVETEERELLIEQDLGPEYTRLLVTGQIEAAGDLKTNGAPPGSRPVDIRRAYRTPGGESQNDLAKRAQLALLQIIFDHGVHLSTPPSPESWDGSLVDSIPHIVLVTHNLFLSELFESLLCWEQSSHTETIIEYGNTEWSRHLLRLDWPDDNFSLKSYRGSFFGLCLGNWYKMWSAF